MWSSLTRICSRVTSTNSMATRQLPLLQTTTRCLHQWDSSRAPLAPSQDLEVKHKPSMVLSQVEAINRLTTKISPVKMRISWLMILGALLARANLRFRERPTRRWSSSDSSKCKARLRLSRTRWTQSMAQALIGKTLKAVLSLTLISELRNECGLS